MKYTVLWILSLVLLSAQNTPSDSQLPWEKSLLRGTLSNGLKYTVLKGDKPKQRAELYLYVGVGSLDEEEDQRGVAHFLEHMAFNGTEHFQKNALISYLESIGMTFGGDLNANTGFDRTLYRISLPLEGDNLSRCVTILRDWAGGLKLNPQELDAERGVILEEERARNTLNYRMFVKALPLSYGHSRYTKRIPIGSDEVIKHVTVERVRDFYETWYRPEFMHIVVVGDFNSTAVISMIQERFGDLENRSTTKRASRALEERNSKRVMSLTDKALPINSVQIGYITERTGMKRAEDKRRILVERMAWMLFGLKAEEQMMKQDPEAMQILTRRSTLSKTASKNLFIATYKNGHAAGALKELYALMWGFGQYGFAPTNVKLAKKLLLSQAEKAHKEVKTMRADQIAKRIIGTIERDSIYVAYDFDFALTKKLIQEISIEELNQYFHSLLKEKDRFVLFQSATEDGLDRNKTLALLDEGETLAVDMSKEENLSKVILAQTLPVTKIRSRSYDKERDIYHYVLENNITVDFKPTQLKKDMLYLQGYSEGGSSVLDLKGFRSMRHAAEWVAYSAPGDLTLTEVKKILSGKRVRVVLGVSRFYETLRGSCSTQDAESMFALLYASVTTPKIDKRVFENGKKELKSYLEQIRQNPSFLFNKLKIERYFKNNPRLRTETIDELEMLDKKEMLGYYKDRFSDMNHFHFSMAGDASPKEVEAWVTRYLGNLPTKSRAEQYRVERYPYLHGAQRVTAKLAGENTATATLSYRSKVPFSLSNELAVDAVRSILEIRLRNVIREDKAGTYGVSVYAEMSSELKDKAVLTITFKADPKRVEALLLTVKKVIEELKTKGVTDKELATFRQMVKTAFKKAQNYNAFWLEMMQEHSRLGLSMHEIMDVNMRLHALTSQEIQEMACKTMAEDLLESVMLPKEDIIHSK